MNATGEERRNALMGKGWARRTVHVHGVTPSGDAVLEAVDDVGRELFAAGEQGALTPSRPRRSNRRPKHVFYSSTAYTVHSPV